MLRRHPLTLALAAVLALAFASEAGAVTSWSLGGDFDADNSTGFGPEGAWSVGGDTDGAGPFLSTAAGAFSFSPFTVRDNSWHQGSGIATRVFTDNGFPGMFKVTSPLDPSISIPVGAIGFHSADSATSPTVVRWRAPRAMWANVNLETWVASDFASGENRIQVGALMKNTSTTDIFGGAGFEFNDPNNAGGSNTSAASPRVFNFDHYFAAGDDLWFISAKRDAGGMAGFVGLSMTVSEVPEPSSALLAVLACGGAACARRGRRVRA